LMLRRTAVLPTAVPQICCSEFWAELRLKLGDDHPALTLFLRPSAMDVKLVVEKGTTERQTWHLHHKDTVVGRRRDCDLSILSSEVSRRHCLLHIDDGYVNVEDLDSINGTFVN